MDAVYPLASPAIVQIFGDLEPDRVVQLLVVAGDHGLLAEVDQQALQGGAALFPPQPLPAPSDLASTVQSYYS